MILKDTRQEEDIRRLIKKGHEERRVTGENGHISFLDSAQLGIGSRGIGEDQ